MRRFASLGILQPDKSRAALQILCGFWYLSFLSHFRQRRAPHEQLSPLLRLAHILLRKMSGFAALRKTTPVVSDKGGVSIFYGSLNIS